MRSLTREAITTAIAAGQTDALQGFMRSARGSMERRAVTEDDIARVREVLGDDAAGARIVPFIVATERRADDGHVLHMSGADLSRYEKNPRVFLAHRWWGGYDCRVGDSVVWKDGDKIRALCAFLTRELSEVLDDGFAYALGELAALRGHAASISWDTLSATPSPEAVRKEFPWALEILLWRMREWSLVNIGSDEDAIDEGRAAGIDVEPLARGFARMLDELEVAGFGREQLERAWARAVDPGRRKAVALPVADSDPHVADAATTQREAPQDAPAGDGDPAPGVSADAVPPPSPEPREATAPPVLADVSAAIRGTLRLAG